MTCQAFVRLADQGIKDKLAPQIKFLINVSPIKGSISCTNLSQENCP